MAKLLAGIEIGGTKLQVFLGHSPKNIIDRITFDIIPSDGASGIRKILQTYFESLKSSRIKISGIGVGFGGPVLRKTGRIHCSHQISGWNRFNLKKWLQGFVRCPVLIDNDANVAALAEASFGSGKGFNPVFYVTLGSGVGGGLIYHGQIYHGASPGESEVGHIRLDSKGSTLESCCSGWAVDRWIRQLKKTHPRSALARTTQSLSSGEAKQLSCALRSRDPMAKKILSKTADSLGFGLSHVTHLFHPEVIILGGGLSLIGEPLRGLVEKSLRTQIMTAFLPGPKIKLSSLKADAVPVGALCLIHSAFSDQKRNPHLYPEKAKQML